jgi:hypothetical protein
MAPTLRKRRNIAAWAAIGIAPWLAEGARIAPPIRATAEAAATDPMMLNRPECDYHDVSPDSIPLSGPIIGIPEFHDCQRFVSGGAYIGLYAIFARYWGSATVNRADSGGVQFPPHIQAAGAPTVVGGAPSGFQMETGAGVVTTISIDLPIQGIPYATIFSYADEAYDPLGIAPGWNCLYLFTDEVDGHWRATMVSQGDDRDCRPPLENPQATGTQLQVRRLVLPGPLPPGTLKYPPVARWDWDRARQVQYIGIWCGGAWCEVAQSSPPEFVPSPPQLVSPHWRPIPGKAFGPVDVLSVLRVKGWYDEQRLAMTGGGGTLTPGSARGTVFPRPALGQLDVPDFNSTWVHVASTRLVGQHGKYYAQLGFREGTSAVFLCHGDWASCYRARYPTGRVPRPPVCETVSSDPWWAMVEREPKHRLETVRPPVFRCVVRRPHPGDFEIPGVARWRWKETDDKVWVRCGAGCCELE